MMTKKTMAILSVFMIVALTAVGFAAWLIVGTIEGEATGSFVSNELEDKYFKVEVNFNNDGTVTDEKGDVIFGRPSADYDYETGSWLSYSNRDPKEKLSVIATVKFIPDAGFNEEKDLTMEYYLRETIEGETKEQDKTQHRTIRVVIDIADIIGDGATDNYKWFDMAVQLGYIQYPTAKFVGNDVVGEKALVWGTPTYDENGKITSITKLADESTKSFEENVLYIDLEYNMFTVDDETKDFATADIQIDFAWGEAFATTVDSKTTYNNPYTFFNMEDHQPELPVTVNYYLDTTAEELKAVNAIANDNEDTTDVVEGYDNADAKTIRYKDLAQRTLDYLYNKLNYVAADAENGVEGSGIQFSITLSEGTAVPAANS